MRNFLLFLALIIFVTSCGQNDSKEKELELQKRELDLKQKELELKEKELNQSSSPVRQNDSITNTSATKENSVSSSLTDADILKFIKKDFSKNRNPESFPEPYVNKVFLLDYNNDGQKDGVAYAIGGEEGSRVTFNGFGLYKNESGKMLLVDTKVSTITNFENVTQSGANVIVKATSFGPDDPQCCPSIKKTMTLSFSNDKILGLQ